MTELFKRTFIALVLCMTFCGLALIVWAAAFWLAEMTGWNIRVFDWISLFLFFAGFLSCCIVNQKNDETDRTD